MKHILAVLLAVFFLGAFQPAKAQSDKEQMIAIYNVATGKHLEFLKWMADGEAIAKEAGAPATQWYVHHDGGSWDFIAIQMVGSPSEREAMDKKIDDLRKKKGMPTGMPAALKFRQYISSHTDTYAGGPYTAADLVKMAEGK